MQSAPKSRDKIEVADVVVSTNHVTFLTDRFPRLISLQTSAIFVSGTSGIIAILEYRSVNPISSRLAVGKNYEIAESALSRQHGLFTTAWILHKFSCIFREIKTWHFKSYSFDFVILADFVSHHHFLPNICGIDEFTVTAKILFQPTKVFSFEKTP